MQKQQGYPTKLSWALVMSIWSPWTADRKGAGTGSSFTWGNMETPMRQSPKNWISLEPLLLSQKSLAGPRWQIWPKGQPLGWALGERPYPQY